MLSMLKRSNFSCRLQPCATALSSTQLHRLTTDCYEAKREYKHKNESLSPSSSTQSETAAPTKTSGCGVCCSSGQRGPV